MRAGRKEYSKWSHWFQRPFNNSSLLGGTMGITRDEESTHLQFIYKK